MKKKGLRYVLIALAIAIGLIWLNSTPKESYNGTPRQYKEIISSGVLRAVTEYNAVSYHVDQDTTLSGFDYEILREFAQSKNLKLQVVPEMNFSERLTGIANGRYDILAVSTPITSRTSDTLLFTHPLLHAKQVLVQRKKADDADSSFISNQLQLAGKRLYVVKNSPALLRIHNLMNEIADTIYVEEVEKYGPEQLLAMVAGKDIDYAVCDETIARTALKNFPDLDISIDIGFTQLYAWGVSKQSTELLDTLNVWLDDYIHTKEYKTIKNKYIPQKHISLL